MSDLEHNGQHCGCLTLIQLSIRRLTLRNLILHLFGLQSSASEPVQQEHCQPKKCTFYGSSEISSSRYVQWVRAVDVFRAVVLACYILGIKLILASPRRNWICPQECCEPAHIILRAGIPGDLGRLRRPTMPRPTRPCSGPCAWRCTTPCRRA